MTISPIFAQALATDVDYARTLLGRLIGKFILYRQGRDVVAERFTGSRHVVHAWNTGPKRLQQVDVVVTYDLAALAPPVDEFAALVAGDEQGYEREHTDAHR
jgi:hypothetical protein